MQWGIKVQLSSKVDDPLDDVKIGGAESCWLLRCDKHRALPRRALAAQSWLGVCRCAPAPESPDDRANAAASNRASDPVIAGCGGALPARVFRQALSARRTRPARRFCPARPSRIAES